MVHSPFQDITEERIQERADFLLEDVEEEDVVTNALKEVPGAVAKKAVRRLSFSSSGGNRPKKLKTSSGTAKEQRKVSKKRVSMTKKAGLVFSVSRVHNRLKEDRYASRVRFLFSMW